MGEKGWKKITRFASVKVDLCNKEKDIRHYTWTKKLFEFHISYR